MRFSNSAIDLGTFGYHGIILRNGWLVVHLCFTCTLGFRTDKLFGEKCQPCMLWFAAIPKVQEQKASCEHQHPHESWTEARDGNDSQEHRRRQETSHSSGHCSDNEDQEGTQTCTAHFRGKLPLFC